MPAISAPAPDPRRRSARLTLTITDRNSVSLYSLSKLQSGRDIRAWRLRRPGEADHLVSQDRKRLHCTCAAGAAGRVCVHVAAMKAAGLLGRE